MVHFRKNLAFAVVAGSLLMLPLVPSALAEGATVGTSMNTSTD